MRRSLSFTENFAMLVWCLFNPEHVLRLPVTSASHVGAWNFIRVMRSLRSYSIVQENKS